MHVYIQIMLIGIRSQPETAASQIINTGSEYHTLWRPDPCIIEHDFGITKTADLNSKHYEK
jgi:hypothetical protein